MTDVPRKRRKPGARAPKPEAPAETRSRAAKPGLLEALAPATEHLFRAAGELVAAATAAVEALPSPGERPRRFFRSGRAALEMLGGAAKAGASYARTKARERVRREALEEIVDSLDRHAEKLKGPAADAFAMVRAAVTGARERIRPEEPEEKTEAPTKRGSKRSKARMAARSAIRREIQRIDEDGPVGLAGDAEE